jgi:superfamily I DNA and/or RNA helicase
VGETKIRIDSSHFDWVIVDEAARCTSSELAVPIQMGRRVLLVGDHLQLMPMIKRNLVDALQEEFPSVGRDDLTRSDFERAFLSRYGKQIGRQLTEQYRMHPQICKLVSSCFYEPHAVTLTTSEERQSSIQIPPNAPAFLTKPICWVDTAAAANSREVQLPNSTTFHNDAEIEAVIKILDGIAAQESLVEQLLRDESETPIGVICMYSGQKRRLELACARHAWAPRFRKLVRVDTVDAYQGKENAIVVVSLVRSNPARMPGHVRSDNRCNVAMSRAKERLIIVGASTMWNAVGETSPMRRAFRYIQTHVAAASVVPVEAL